MIVRSAGIADIPIIRSIAQATWPVAYVPHIISAAQLAYMLDLLYSAEALETAMRSKGQSFLIAERDGAAIAFAGYTPHNRPGITHLNKLYTMPSAQGGGAGRALLQRVLVSAEEAGDTAVELNVNKRNPAIALYAHHGFSVLREEVIDIGSGYVMDDYVMGRTL